MATFPSRTATLLIRSSIPQNRQRIAVTAVIGGRNWQSSTRIKLTNHYSAKSLSTIVTKESCQLFHTSDVVVSASSSCDSNPSPNPRFSFNVAASYVAKHSEFNSYQDFFDFKLDNPDTAFLQSLTRQQHQRLFMHGRPTTGQDAFFVSQVGQTSDIVMGIADGVGGWANSGVDPADFSHGICHYMKYAASTYREKDWGGYEFGAQSLMQRGYNELCQDRSVKAGSSTACVAVARGSGILEVANLGDSGYIQLRLNTVHSYSDPQTHSFNAPYQLAIIPNELRKKTAIYGGSQIFDLPRDADVTQNDLKHGDVIVIGSDGLWDNLFYSEILKIVSHKMLRAKAWEYSPSGGFSVGKNLAAKVFESSPNKASGHPSPNNLHCALAINITAEAKAASINADKDGPFTRDVQLYEPGMYWRGGKIDDICVIIAIVCEQDKC